MLSWKFVVGQVIAAVIYLLVGAYQVGVYSARMQALETSVNNLSQKVDKIYEHNWGR
jgi:hypothetical protein